MNLSLSDEKRRVVGTRQIVRMAGQDKLEVVYLAQDAQERIRTVIEQACGAAGVPIVAVPDMKSLGKACAISVAAAAAGLLKPD